MGSTLLSLGLCFLLSSAAAFGHPAAHDKLAYINQRIEEKPDDQQLYIQRGSTYSTAGKFESALHDFRRAEALGSPLAVAFEMGVLHYRQGNYTQARAYLDRWLWHSPGHTPALEYRARLLRDAGDHAASLADYKALFKLRRSSDPGNYIAAAKMLATQGDSGLAAAIDLLDQGIRQLGLTPQLQRYAIRLELRLQRIGNAIARLGSLELMLGQSPDWKTDMGELLLLEGKNAEAQALFDAAAAQLATLRTTPARLKLLEKIQSLNPR